MKLVPVIITSKRLGFKLHSVFEVHRKFYQRSNFHLPRQFILSSWSSENPRGQFHSVLLANYNIHRIRQQCSLFMAEFDWYNTHIRHPAVMLLYPNNIKRRVLRLYCNCYQIYYPVSCAICTKYMMTPDVDEGKETYMKSVFFTCVAWWVYLCNIRSSAISESFQSCLSWLINGSLMKGSPYGHAFFLIYLWYPAPLKDADCQTCTQYVLLCIVLAVKFSVDYKKGLNITV